MDRCNAWAAGDGGRPEAANDPPTDGGRVCAEPVGQQGRRRAKRRHGHGPAGATHTGDGRTMEAKGWRLEMESGATVAVNIVVAARKPSETQTVRINLKDRASAAGIIASGQWAHGDNDATPVKAQTSDWSVVHMTLALAASRMALGHPQFLKMCRVCGPAHMPIFSE